MQEVKGLAVTSAPGAASPALLKKAEFGRAPRDPGTSAPRGLSGRRRKTIPPHAESRPTGYTLPVDILLNILTPAQFALAAAGILFASLMRAFSGFGFALTAVPVFSLFLAPGDAVVLAAALTLSVSLMTYRAWWGKFDVTIYWPMVAGSIIGTGVGVTLLSQFSTEQFQLWIGLTVIGACLLLSQYQPGAARGGPWWAAGTGVASGAMNGAFAIPGPPAIIYAMACITKPAESRAFLMAFFMASNAISLPMFAVAGLVTVTPFYLVLIGLPVMILGDRLGAWLFHHYGGVAYRPIALGVSMAIGFSITGRALWSMGFIA